MMGKGHAALGAATWTATATFAFPHFNIEPNPAVLILGCLPVAGASLRPDIDHPNGTIANSGGFITGAIASGANALSGGHREGTHRLWFFAACAIFDFFLAGTFGKPAALALFFLYTAFGTQALATTTLHQAMNRKWQKNTGIFSKLYCWAFAAAATGAAWYIFPANAEWWWLPIALTIGHFTHLVGDSLTTAGLEWANGHRVRFPIIGDAGSSRETLLSLALAGVTVILIIGSVFGNPIEGLSLPDWNLPTGDDGGGGLR